MPVRILAQRGRGFPCGGAVRRRAGLPRAAVQSERPGEGPFPGPGGDLPARRAAPRGYWTPRNRCPVVAFGIFATALPSFCATESARRARPTAWAASSLFMSVVSTMNAEMPHASNSGSEFATSSATLLYRWLRPSASVTTGNSKPLRSRR